MVTASYNGDEFFRVGYYVNIMYATDELNECPPAQPDMEQLGRLVMVDNPRVTNFPIQWDDKCGSNTLEIVPPEQMKNFDPLVGFGNNKDMVNQDRKDMFSDQNVQNAADVLKTPFANATNVQ